MKILVSKPGDSAEEIEHSRSLGRDQSALLYLSQVYKQFLLQLGATTIQDDKQLLEAKHITHRKYVALQYRIEMKEIVSSQIRLCQIAASIIERVRAGVSFELACSRVPSVEESDDVLLNRRMLGKYLVKIKDMSARLN
eukprot:TRINITY_DN2841_c0_g1_i3.p2 TRINITY_DN2841_c0_g1~~TRINITY_DN2841_c0_g1_i3.p2  ORF type:complete len:139 (+),score=27.74 TRINITY_DN2841_c0_g1_i3:764-1180(+)